MKRSFVFAALFAILFPVVVLAQATPATAAEVTFTYTKRSGAGSNQFAVWVENAQGRHVKTLYATRFTANGGWQRRATSIPVWVKQSALADMNKTQVDALTGATPKAGALTYKWDGTDSKGIAVPAGNYVICIEATLRMDNQVYYRAPVVLGKGASEAEVSVEYKGDPGPDKEMIKDVKVRMLR